MKQALEYYIRKDKVFRQTLLERDGGIMKYWAENPDRDFDVDLFEGYEREIAKAYLKANMRNRAIRSLPKAELRLKSLEWYHSKESEFKFFLAMKPSLNTIDVEVSEQVLNYIEIYMADAYKESHRCKYPEGMPTRDFYNKVLEIYGPLGLAIDSLERVLQEYRGKAVRLGVKHFFQTLVTNQGESPELEEINSLQAEFDMRMFKKTFFAEGGYKKLRQAVKELFENGTMKLAEEDRRKLYREMAKDEMRKVYHFTRWVNNETYPMMESEGGELVPLITPEERHWLRNIMYDNSPGATGTQKLTTMGRYYCYFVSVLQNIGEIWAAQLLVHGIDMKELEKETNIILSREINSMYYVDRMLDDRRGDCCVYDWSEAEELLSKLKSNDEENHDVGLRDVLAGSACGNEQLFPVDVAAQVNKKMAEEEDPFEEDEDKEETDDEEEAYDDIYDDVNIQDWNLFKDWILKDKVIEAIRVIPIENVVGDVKRHFVIHKVLKEIGWFRYNQSTRYVGLMKYHKVVDFKAKGFQDDDLKPFKKNPTGQWGSHLTPGRNLGEQYRKFAETVRNTFTRIINGELDDLKEFYVPGKKKYNQVVADNSKPQM